MAEPKKNTDQNNHPAVKRINRSREIDFLIHSLLSGDATLDIMQLGQRISGIKIHRRDGDFLICETDVFKTSIEKVKLSFFVAGSPYHAETQLDVIEEGLVRVKVPNELYQIQQRQSHRIQLPPDYGAMLKMDAPHFGSFRVEDLSAEGLQLMIPNGVTPIEEGQKVNGVLHLGKNRRPLALTLLVRRRRTVDEHTCLGLELSNPDQQTRGEFLHYVIDIYRELQFSAT